MLKLAARWLKNEPPHELEFEGFSEGHLLTRTGASSEPGSPKRFHSPKDLVALGIAGCTGVDVVSILKKMRQPLEDLIIEAELTQTTEHPRVFDSCRLTYRFSGRGLERDRVVRAVGLSYGKYCGVSAMIKRSGCYFEPHLFLNNVDISDDLHRFLDEMKNEANVQVLMASSAALLITGNEILNGKTQETNGRYLARHLYECGIQISELRVIGDNRQKLTESLSELIQSNSVVIITGGLGPTKDDLTSEIVSAVTHLPQKFSQDAWNVCERAFQKLGRTEIPESNKKQAMLPEGAFVLDNPMGTAAGFAVQTDVSGHSSTIIALPGVPWECESMYQEQVQKMLPKSFSAYHIWGPWVIWGVGESALQSLIADIERKIETKVPQVEFSFQANAGFVTYLIRAYRSPEFTEPPDISDELNSLETLLGDKLLYKGKQTLVEKFLEEAKKLSMTVAIAESCTGGRIAADLTSLPGSSEIFFGGVVAYSNDVKMRILGVSNETLEGHGAVSLQSAAEMAEGVRSSLSSSIALSVTGIAGPGGGTQAKPVGTVCFGIALSGLFHGQKFEEIWSDDHFAQLKSQGWTLMDPESMTLVVEKRFGTHLSRDLLQRRASMFGLCSLVAVAEIMRGYSSR